MIAAAQLCHAAPGRCRLRITGRRRDHAYFEAVRAALARLTGVLRVEVNPAAATVLIEHADLPLAALAEAGRAAGLFELEGAEKRSTVAEQAGALGAELDGFLREMSRGLFDLRSAGFLLLALLALMQARRGQLLGPAATLLWYAFSLVGRGRRS